MTSDTILCKKTMKPIARKLDGGWCVCKDPNKCEVFPEITPMKIIVDIWAGENSQEWIARYIRDVDDCFDIVKMELQQGNLVNLRQEADFGDYEEYDSRKKTVQ